MQMAVISLPPQLERQSVSLFWDLDWAVSSLSHSAPGPDYPGFHSWAFPHSAVNPPTVLGDVWSSQTGCAEGMGHSTAIYQLTVGTCCRHTPDIPAQSGPRCLQWTLCGSAHPPIGSSQLANLHVVVNRCVSATAFRTAYS